MGDPEGGPLPSGLIHTQAAAYADSFTKSRSVDDARWKQAEKHTEELIKRIRGTRSSEARRKDVADHVRDLIKKSFDCQVNTYGSVPLKTYLPDGDIDLTIVSRDPRLKDSWANSVRLTLDRNKEGKFRISDIQVINAEVKLIKCRVENIVVDISFNQFGGLCTLCFLEEVDRVIGRDHFFKRSIILVKAWCYYDSTILGAHHGLISTYALETLVLYIFHVFHNSLRGPLEVLLRFLEFFSKFDWYKYAISVWGPVPLSSLPEMIAEPPRNDDGELLLSKDFLDACVEDYAVFFTGPDSGSGKVFSAKHLNVVDPLRASNNLGRSVNQSSFNRIIHGLRHSADKLLKFLLDSSQNVDEFFKRTNDRLDQFEHKRPDAAAAAASSATPQYAMAAHGGGLIYQNVGVPVVDEVDSGRSYVAETNKADPILRNKQEGWASELDQRKQSSAPAAQMGGSHSNAFYPSSSSNGGVDSRQFPSENGTQGVPVSKTSVAEAGHSQVYVTGGKGRLSNGEAVAKPSAGVTTKTRRQQQQQIDARGSVDNSTQSSEGQNFASSSSEYRNSSTQTNFDRNGALITSSESPSSESSSRGSVNFSNEAVALEGTLPAAKRSSPNHTIETEFSRRNSWSGEQPSYVAANGYLDGQGYAQQRGQESLSGGSSLPPSPPVSVIPHAPIPVTLPHPGGQMPMQLATSMAASQPMIFTSQHATGNVSTTSIMGESPPVGIGPRVGQYYTMQLPRGPPAPPLPPGYFHGPPPLVHHLPAGGEIPNSAAGRITTSFPIQQQGDDQMYEQQQQAWQQQVEQMQLHGHWSLRPAVPTINAAAVSPLPQLMNSENSTVISSSSVGFAPFPVPVSSLPATRPQNNAHNGASSTSSIHPEAQPSSSSTGIGHEVQAGEGGKSLSSHGEAGNPITGGGGKSSLQAGSETGGARAVKNSKSGKEKRTSSRSKSVSNDDAPDAGSFDLGGGVGDSAGHQPIRASAGDAAHMRQAYPQLVSVAGPSAYAQVVSSSLPHGSAFMGSELSPYPPPPPPAMVPTPKSTVVYTSLPPQTSIQASPPSLPGGIPAAELVNGGAAKQRQRPTDSVPHSPVYYPSGNAYPLLSMQRVYVVPPQPGHQPSAEQVQAGLDTFKAMHFSNNPFESYSDGSAAAAGQADDPQLRSSQQRQQQQQLQGRLGVGERLRAAGVATSSNSGSEATATDAERGASDGVESNFVGGDLLSSDLGNHVRNLDFARWCQNKHVPMPIPAGYGPQQYMGPSPKFYPDYRSWEGPGRPLAPNANIYPNVMNYGHGLVQGAQQSMSTTPMRMVGGFPPRSFTGPPGTYSNNNDELPKSHGGTGTYLPHPRPQFFRDKTSPGNGRNPHGGGSNQDRGERVDRDGNQVNGPRLRGAARGQSKYEPRPQNSNVSAERNNTDARVGDRGRDRDVHRQHQQQQEGQRRAPTQSAPGAVFVSPSVGVAPVAVMAQAPPAGPPPPVEMYSAPNTTGNGKPSTSGAVGGPVPSVIVANPLEFGLVGQVQVGASQGGSEVDRGADHASSSRTHEQQLNAHTSPAGLVGLYLAAGDGSSQGPSSPKQRVVQGAYELTEEDFPPLSIRGQH